MKHSALVTVALVSTLSFAACGSTEHTTPAPKASGSGTPESPPVDGSTVIGKPDKLDQLLDIAVYGNSINPVGQQLDVKLGRPLLLKIVSDRPGELHFHSKPEQTVKFGDGNTTRSLKFSVPGVVEVEEHESRIRVATLQVR